MYPPLALPPLVSREPIDEPSVLWQTQLDSPITDVWVHVGGRLEKVTHHGRPSGRGRDPSLMIINYKNQYYIQPTAVAPPTYLLTAQPSYQPRPWKVCVHRLMWCDLHVHVASEALCTD